MRILFDSKQLIYKDPFGTLVPDQTCTLNIHIPSSVQATAVTCIVTHEDGSEAFSFPLTYKIKKGAYEIFQGKFSFAQTGLYFYYFRIDKRSGSFRLYKQGDLTNMEDGELWQVSCVPADFTTRLGQGRYHLSALPRPFPQSRQVRPDRKAGALHRPQRLVRRSPLAAHRRR